MPPRAYRVLGYATPSWRQTPQELPPAAGGASTLFNTLRQKAVQRQIAFFAVCSMFLLGAITVAYGLVSLGSILVSAPQQTGADSIEGVAPRPEYSALSAAPSASPSNEPFTALLARVRGKEPGRDLARLTPGVEHRRCAIPGVAALTIDDGDDHLFGVTLDALKAANVPATFFLVGKNLRRTPARVALNRRALLEGHSLQHHSWSHPTKPVESVASIRSEIDRGIAELRVVTPEPVRYFRPPQGLAGAPRLVREANARGLAVVSYTYAFQDDTPGANQAALFSNYTSYIRKKSKATVLGHILRMHFYGSAEHGGAGAPQLIPRIAEVARAVGLRWVSLDECLGVVAPKGRKRFPTKSERAEMSKAADEGWPPLATRPVDTAGRVSTWPISLRGTVLPPLPPEEEPAAMPEPDPEPQQPQQQPEAAAPAEASAVGDALAPAAAGVGGEVAAPAAPDAPADAAAGPTQEGAAAADAGAEEAAAGEGADAGGNQATPAAGADAGGAAEGDAAEGEVPAEEGAEAAADGAEGDAADGEAGEPGGEAAEDGEADAQ